MSDDADRTGVPDGDRPGPGRRELAATIDTLISNAVAQQRFDRIILQATTSAAVAQILGQDAAMATGLTAPEEGGAR